jgi:hypothetical protein
MNDAETAMSSYERHRQALTAANITRLIVEFDGEGDSGQISDIAAFRGKERIEIPATTVIVQNIAWGNLMPVTTESILGNAIETLCYDCLEETHGGWENNDGAFGEFHFDVSARTIDLEFHGRFTDTFTSNHTF